METINRIVLTPITIVALITLGQRESPVPHLVTQISQVYQDHQDQFEAESNELETERETERERGRGREMILGYQECLLSSWMRS